MIDIPPQVTVVIPNFNHAAFLVQRIESVLAQNYHHFEVIIFDDNSNDNSLEIISGYKDDPKIKAVVINEKNSGSVFEQWVKGIEVAKGKFLWIAESDDFADKQFLAEVIPVLESNSNMGLVFTDSYEVDTTGKKIRKNSDRMEFLKSIKKYPCIFQDHQQAPFFFIEQMLIQNVSCVVFNLDKLKKEVDVGRLKIFKNTGDRYTYLSMFLKYEMAYLNKPLNYMRIHGENTTKKNTKSGLIYGERVETVTLFIDQISDFLVTPLALKNFLRDSFLSAIDYSHFKEIHLLLNKMNKFQFLSLSDFIFLKGYTYIAQVTSKTPPHFLRTMAKNRLK